VKIVPLNSSERKTRVIRLIAEKQERINPAELSAVGSDLTNAFARKRKIARINVMMISVISGKREEGNVEWARDERFSEAEPHPREEDRRSGSWDTVTPWLFVFRISDAGTSRVSRDPWRSVQETRDFRTSKRRNEDTWLPRGWHRRLWDPSESSGIIEHRFCLTAPTDSFNYRANSSSNSNPPAMGLRLFTNYAL